MKKTFFSIIFTIAFLTSLNITEAATLYLLPEYKNIDIGQEFFVDVKVNSENDFINAVQSTISFPSNIIEILSIDKHESVFNFWIDEPDIEENEITFIGGTAKGVSGDSLQIIRIQCKSIGAGIASVNISKSVITANDGKGTNILSTIEKTDIEVGTATITSNASIKIKPEEVPIIIPQEIQREAILASDTPDKPVITVPLYPNQELWYNHQGETIVLWEVPDDITKVAVSLNSNPNSEPNTSEEGLFTGKTFGALDEGIYFVHVQFKNNKGWGEIAHYKISLDISSPITFETKISSFASSDPSPEISFINQDNLSGFSHALIFVDGEKILETKESKLLLPAQKPGSHLLVVQIFDKAGNSIEDDLNFEIIPLKTPSVNFFTDKISQGENIFISGTSIPNSFVDVRIQQEDIVEFSGFTEVDNAGKWSLVIDKLLAKGNYTLNVSARNTQGAISFDTENNKIRVTSPTILSIGLIDLGWFDIFILIILIIVIGGSIGIWYYFSQKEMAEAYKIIANRDVKKMSKLLNDDITLIEKEIKNEKKIPAKSKSSIKNHITKIKTNIKKMDKYLGIEISKSK
ncbi:MAG: hypothetical protein KAS02_02285 [Candidatus Pacebacteria bacterium]|nr:hypothetical protein [Candidatus Paceibacterota bacterium]